MCIAGAGTKSGRTSGPPRTVDRSQNRCRHQARGRQLPTSDRRATTARALSFGFRMAACREHAVRTSIFFPPGEQVADEPCRPGARRVVRSMAHPQPCPQAFPIPWAAGEAGASFSGTSSAAPGTAALPTLEWHFSAVSAESLRVRPPWGFGFHLASSTDNQCGLWECTLGVSAGWRPDCYGYFSDWCYRPRCPREPISGSGGGSK